jgi:alcohol dehydrogenase (cytochrome c)/quinohemoprotein ethanol dehydrogenase
MPQAFNTGVDFAAGAMPDDPEVQKQALEALVGHLSAWDPVTQKEVFRVQRIGPWNGGLLTTAGNLLVQGLATHDFNVYRADNGEQLFQFDAQSGIMAAPVTYSVDGEQYLAVTVGWGGVMAMAPGILSHKSRQQTNLSRVLAFKLGGSASLPPMPEPAPRTPTLVEREISDETTAQGKAIYHRFCGTCHGDSAVAGGIIPDLRYSPVLGTEAFYTVVRDGALKNKGMAPFGSVLSDEQIGQVESYLVTRARRAAQATP